MKSVRIVLALIVLTAAVAYAWSIKNKNSIDIISIEQSASYGEYAFDSGDDIDLGFTYRALSRFQEEQALLSANSQIIADASIAYVFPAERNQKPDLMERRTWDGDTYDLMHDLDSGISGNFRMLKNGGLLFEEPMDYGAAGPILDWRIVNDKPAFTFTPECPMESSQPTCGTDIWYDGDFLSEKFDVENPRYLFAYEDKLGFVATDDGQDKIFFNDKFITPGFDFIWIHNCCSMTEILPTVYENGALLFYAQRDEVNYLVEVRLE